MTRSKRIAWFALAAMMLVLTGCHHHRGYHYYNAPGYSPYYGSPYGNPGRPYYRGHGHHHRHHHHDDWD